jgi:hypothetical protein
MTPSTTDGEERANRLDERLTGDTSVLESWDSILGCHSPNQASLR